MRGGRTITTREVPMRNRSVLVVSTVMLALVGAGRLWPVQRRRRGRSSTSPPTKDYRSCSRPRKSVPHGPVTFAIENDGKAVHDFEIAGHTSHDRARKSRRPSRCS